MNATAIEIKPNTAELLPLAEYDKIIVAFSGGKDCTAAFLHLLEQGADPARMELWHHDVDGREGEPLMDWGCTPSYCRAFAKAMGVRIRFQWKEGGFCREMLRENSKTAPVMFELEDGTIAQAGGKLGKETTRLKFPQVSADLSVRWCSAYLKIDVAAIALNNDPSMVGKKILFVTGERRQESTARSKYAEVEEHRCHSGRKTVHQWRAVIDYSEQDVWEIIERHKVRPHPAYYLGWGRVSCLLCIFGDNDQMASARKLAPAQFDRVAGYEADFGVTIRKGLTVVSAADKGTPYPEVDVEELRAMAMSHNYPVSMIRFADGAEWVLPSGAYKRCGGPT